MHFILQLINRLKSKNKSYHSKENTTLKFVPQLKPFAIHDFFRTWYFCHKNQMKQNDR